MTFRFRIRSPSGHKLLRGHFDVASNLPKEGG